MTDPVYLDNAATTPVQPEVLEAMLPFLSAETFGNPSSPHRFGRAARAAVEHAKRQVAEGLGADPVDVIFTSGGTEARHETGASHSMSPLLQQSTRPYLPLRRW
jgi:cysteine desulfurase